MITDMFHVTPEDGLIYKERERVFFVFHFCDTHLGVSLIIIFLIFIFLLQIYLVFCLIKVIGIYNKKYNNFINK